jgi:membrane protein required for colicin V production
MTSVDLLVLGVMMLSALIAFMRGLVREVLSIAAWLGAAAVSVSFLPMIRPMISPYVPSPEWTDPAGYVILFLVALIVFSLVAKTIGGAVRASAIGGIDRSLGLLFGLARGAVLAIAVYIVGGMAVPPERWPAQVLDARSLPLIFKGAEWVVRQIPVEYRPKVEPLPPSRQASLDGILNASPTGRAIDPPIRR